MRWFYILAVGTMIVLGLAPFYLITPPDMSMLQPPKHPAQGRPPASRAEVSVLYDTYGAKIKSLDPATCGDTSSAGVQGNFYETFYAYHYLKRPLEVVPALAASLPEISGDALTYTIHLKKGLKYHRNACFGAETDSTGHIVFEDDGKTPRWRTREVVAADFVLAFKRIADYHITTELSLAFIEDKVVGIADYRARTQSYAKGDFTRYTRENIEGVKAPDPYTVRIRLKAPFPQLPYVLAINNYAPIPHETLDYWLSTTPGPGGSRAALEVGNRSPEILDYRAAVGTGAYYLADFRDGGRIVLCRNPDYRAECYPTDGQEGDKEAGLLDDAGNRLPFIDVVYLDYAAETNPMWMLFMTRQSDVAGIPQEMYKQVITPSKELDEKMSRQGVRLLKYTGPSVYWLTFNMEDPVLGKSKSLRQGLCLALNVEQYIHVLHNDRGRRAINVIPGSFDGHDQTGPGPYCHFSPPEARVKIDRAKSELLAAGVIKPGEPIPALTLDVGGVDEESRRMGEFIQTQFKDVGVDLNVELQDWPTLLAKMNKKQCQIYSSGWSADYPDAENFLQLFYSPNIDRGTNNANYTDAEFDNLYERAAAMAPSPQRTALYVQAARKLNEDCPMLLLSEPISYLLIHPWVHNVKPHPLGYGMDKYWRIDARERRLAGGR